MNKKSNNRILKWIFRLTLGLAIVLILAYVLIQQPKTQQFIVNKITVSLSQQLGTTVKIGTANFRFFDLMVLEDVYIADQQGDTLLFAKNIKANIALFSLLKRKALIENFTIEGLILNTYEQEPDATYNYEFIYDTFSTSDKKKSSLQPGWEISLRQVNLNNFQYKQKTLLFQETTIIGGHLSLLIDKLDLQKEQITIRSVTFDNLNFDVLSEPPKPTIDPQQTSSPIHLVPITTWTVYVKNISGSNSAIYVRQASEIAEERKINNQNLRFNQMNFDIGDLALSDNEITGHINKMSFTEHSGFDLNQMSAEVLIGTSEIKIKNLVIVTPHSSIQNNMNLSIPTTTNRNDLVKKLKIESRFQKSHLGMQDLVLFVPDISKYVNSGLVEPISIEGSLKGTMLNAKVSNLNVQIGKHLSFTGNVQTANLDNINRATYILDFTKVKTSHQSLSKLLRNIDLPKELASLGDFTFKSNLEGSLSQLKINSFDLTSSSDNSLSATGMINEIDQLEKLRFDLDIDHIHANVESIKPLFGDSITLLDQVKDLTYKGQIFGDLHDLHMKGDLTSNLGNLQSDLQFSFADDYSTGSYVGNFSLDHFDAGTLLAKPDLGFVSLDMTVDGSGWTLPTLQAEVNSQIRELNFNQNTYSDIAYIGIISDGRLSGKLSVVEEFINTIFEGTIEFRDPILKVDLIGEINKFKLKELNLTEQPINASLKTTIQLSGKDIDQLTGKILIQDLLLDNDSIKYSTDVITLISSREEITNGMVKLTSAFLDVEVSGRFHIAQIPTIIQEHLYEIIPNELIVQGPIDLKSSNNRLNTQDSFKLDVKFKDYGPFAVLGIHDIPNVSAAHIELAVDEVHDKMALNGTIDRFEYDDLSSEFISINTATRGKEIEAKIYAINTSFKNDSIPYSTVSAWAQDENIQYSLEFSKDSIEHFIKAGGQLTKKEGLYQLKVRSPIILFNDAWNVSEDHSISWEQGRFLIRDFKLENQGKSVLINSLHDEPNQKMSHENIDVQFNDFPIDYITHSFQNDIGNISGDVKGSIQLKGSFTFPAFSAELFISNIIAENVPIGNISILAKDSLGLDHVSIQSSLTGNQNEISAKGTLNKNTGHLEVETDVEKLSLASLDPFLEGIVNNSKGHLKGSLKIQGPYMHPIVKGELSIHNYETDIEYSKMRYFIDDQSITLTENEIDLGQMNVLDSEKRKATLSGKLIHSNYQNFQLDLSFATEEFKFLNTTSSDNDLFYGKLFLKADGTINGPAEIPIVNINAKTLENSILYISPFLNIDINQNDDFVIFSTPENYDVGGTIQVNSNVAFPLVLTLNLELTDDAEFQFIVDPESGDKLICKGASNLTITAKPPGTMEIYGTYVISSGQYEFSYSEFLKKNFVAQKGSTVTFNGDPTNAVFNAKATYTTQTSPYELIKNETTLSSTELLMARRKTPFEIALILNGELKSPEILFDISVPEYSSGTVNDMVSVKLQNLKANPGEMNKQVFGLLLFNSFMVSGGSTDVGTSSLAKTGTSQALSSVSKLFTQELNKLAEKYIKGVEVNFDINSYQTDEQMDLSSSVVTTVGVGVSKQLMGDRIRIQASGNVDFEDTDQTNRYTSLVGNFLLEYKLTENGQYLLRVYRRDNSDTFTGERSSKNGVGILFKKSFDDRSK